MKEGKVFLIIWGLVVIGLIAASIFLAYKGVEGWGWFLFVAVLIAGGASYSDTDKKKKKKSPTEGAED